MKKNNLIKLLILFLLGVSVILSLFLPQITTVAKPQDIVQISIIMREIDQQLWKNMRLGAEDAAAELGAEIRFLTASYENEGENQLELITREKEADAIIIVPDDSMEEVLNTENDKTKIISLDSFVEGAQLNITPDYISAGEQLASAVTADKYGRNIYIVDSSMGRKSIREYMKSVEKTLNRYNIQSQTISLSGDYSKLDTTNIENPSLIITLDAYSTELAARWKEETNADSIIYGTGISPYITSMMEGGSIKAVIAWSDYAAGYLAVENAIRLINNKKVLDNSLPFRIVKGEEMYEPENEKLLFPVIS